MLQDPSEQRIVLRIGLGDEWAFRYGKNCLKSAYCYLCLLFGWNIQLRLFTIELPSD